MCFFSPPSMPQQQPVAVAAPPDPTTAATTAANNAALAQQNAQASATRRAFAQGPQSLINQQNGYLGITGNSTGSSNLGSA